MMKSITMVILILLIVTTIPCRANTYDVSGYDDNGNYVYGEIEAEGEKYGHGEIFVEDGNQRDIDFEWTGYGELEATDDEGNIYDLDVD